MAAFAEHAAGADIEDLAAEAEAALRRPSSASGVLGEQLRRQMRESMKALSGPAMSVQLAEQMRESMKALSGPAMSVQFAEQMRESMKALSGPAMSAQLAEQMRESMKALSGPAMSAQFAEQMRESVKALTSHLSPLEGPARTTLSYVLGLEAGEVLQLWSPQEAVLAAVDVASAITSNERADGGAAEDPSQALAASAAVLLATVLAIGPSEALQSIWTVGYLCLSLIGHLDATSPAFHGLVVVVGMLAIFSWRR